MKKVRSRSPLRTPMAGIAYKSMLCRDACSAGRTVSHPSMFPVLLSVAVVAAAVILLACEGQVEILQLGPVCDNVGVAVNSSL